MSVIIRGLKMPISCYNCPIRKRNGMEIQCPVCGETFSIADVNISLYRLKNCPLVELPAEHGRLIDGDMAEVIPAYNINGDFADGILYAADWIAAQPTIIEAEGEE